MCCSPWVCKESNRTSGLSSNRRTWKLIRRSPEARLKECRLCTHPDPYQQSSPSTVSIKLLTKSARMWNHIFWIPEPTVSTFAGNTVRLFSSTSPKTLSPGVNTGAQRSNFGIRLTIYSLWLSNLRALFHIRLSLWPWATTVPHGDSK